MPTLLERLNKQSTLLDRLGQRDREVLPPVDISQIGAPPDAYMGIDDLDIDKRAKEVFEIAEYHLLPINAVEDNYDEIKNQIAEYDPEELRAEIEAPPREVGLGERAWKSLLKKTFINPLIAIETKSKTFGGIGILLEFRNQMREFTEENDREPTPEELADLSHLAKAIYIQGVYDDYSFLDVPPAETIPEKIIEIGAGLTSFITHLAVAKKILGPATTKEGLLARDVTAWEIVNLAEGGPVGKGAAMRLAFAGIERVPTRTVVGGVFKVTAQGTTLASATAIAGGNKEDIAIAFLIPFALKAIKVTGKKTAKITRAVLENRTVKNMRNIGADKGYDLSGVPDEALKEIINTAKTGNWWSRQFRKGKISQDVLDKRLLELRERIKPITDAISKQQPHKDVMARYTKRISDRAKRGGPMAGRDIKAMVAQGQQELDKALAEKATPFAYKEFPAVPPIGAEKPPEPAVEPAKPAEAPVTLKPEPEVAKVAKARDILGGVDPIQQIHKALKEAKVVQPITEAQKKETQRKRVGAFIGAMKSNVKKGTPVEEAIFRSTGLLKGPLAEYDQVYSSIEDILEPGAKDAGYRKIYEHPGLRPFEILNTATSFKKLLAGAALTPGDVENIERVFGKEFKDITEVRETRSGLYDRLVTLWRAGLLTGIKTSGLNLMSTASHAISETAKDVPAAFIDSGLSLVTKERTLAFTAKGYGFGFVEGLGRGWKYMKTGLDERNVGEKYDYKRTNFGTSKRAKAQQAYTEFIFHLLGAEDQPFYYGAYSRSLYSQAIAQAKNKGLKGKALRDFVNNLQKNPTDDMLDLAKEDAEGAIYTNRTALGDLGRDIQKIPGGKVIAPFTRTPSAVAMQIINYSPVGLIKEIAQEIHEGKFNQRKVSQAGGRAVVGTGALYLGTLLLIKGLLSLGYPKGERERKLWELEGRKPNSVLIGGKWRDVQVFGPVGNLLIIGGYFQQALDDKGSPTAAIVEAVAGGGKAFSEQTFVRGFNMAIDALVEPEASFETWFSSMAGSVVPTLVADIARAQDDIGRRTVGPIERIQARIPFYRKGLPPKIDVFGQDLPRYGGNVLETMIDPSRPSKIRQDIVVDELRRLFDKGIKISPTLLGDKAGYDILTPEENTLLWQRAGELTYKVLLDRINSLEYRKVENDFVKATTWLEPDIAIAKEAAKMEMAGIKLGQGVPLIKLIESGLYTIEGARLLIYQQKGILE